VTRDEAMETTARLYAEAAGELQLAAEHCLVASRHFSEGVVPRGAAHAEALLDEQAREHASRSVPQAD
jgi:hypothetical protein